MKKLLAFLLAMMLPVCALAETYSISIDVKSEGNALVKYITEPLMPETAEDIAAFEAEAKLLQKLLNGAGLDMVVQEDAAYMELRLSGKPILDFTSYMDDEALWLTSSLIPGYALGSRNEAADADQAALDALDWEGAVNSVLPGLHEWASSIKPSEARGVFMGDAYEGGIKCTTWTITDMDVVSLVNHLLTEETRKLVSELLNSMELDATALLQRLDELNAQVAKENQYSYVFRLVQGPQEVFVGASLTVLQAQEQIATISLGVQDEELRVVVGIGLAQQNYWCEATIIGTHAQDSLSVSGSICEWVGNKADAFAYIRATAEPDAVWDWELTIAETDGGYDWTFNAHSNGAAEVSASGTFSPDTCELSGEFTLGPADASLLSIAFDMGPSAAIQPMEQGLERVSIDDPAATERSNELFNQIAAMMMARLLKLLPMDMILDMNPFTLP